ncbi:MAG: N-acetyltransferase, partial [Myxococcota bacterium]
RPLRSDDVSRVVAIAIQNGMFTASESGFLVEKMQSHLAADEPVGRWVVHGEQGGEEVRGVAFYEPKEATDRVWFLTMIAVHPEARGKGFGSQLLAATEEELRGEGQRLLLVETSSTDQFASSRSFYEKNGYQRVATVPGYFGDGDDMVLYWKDLRASLPARRNRSDR